MKPFKILIVSKFLYARGGSLLHKFGGDTSETRT